MSVFKEEREQKFISVYHSYVSGYAEPLEHIARRYGMKLNTVKTRLFRIRGRLRDYLESEGILL